MIQVENIHKSFGDNKVLKGISTSFEKGKTSLIIGQSGSGKTVFLKCLLGLFGLDSGNILYDKDNYANMTLKKKRKLREKMGMVFQGSALSYKIFPESNPKRPKRHFRKTVFPEPL